MLNDKTVKFWGSFWYNALYFRLWAIVYGIGCSLNIVFFCDFSELYQFCCSAGALPSWCVYTHWHQGKTEIDQSPEYSKIFRKNTIFNEHPVHPFSVFGSDVGWTMLRVWQNGGKDQECVILYCKRTVMFLLPQNGSTDSSGHSQTWWTNGRKINL